MDSGLTYILTHVRWHRHQERDQAEITPTLHKRYHITYWKLTYANLLTEDAQCTIGLITDVKQKNIIIKHWLLMILLMQTLLPSQVVYDKQVTPTNFHNTYWRPWKLGVHDNNYIYQCFSVTVHASMAYHTFFTLQANFRKTNLRHAVLVLDTHIGTILVSNKALISTIKYHLGQYSVPPNAMWK